MTSGFGRKGEVKSRQNWTLPPLASELLGRQKLTPFARKRASLAEPPRTKPPQRDWYERNLRRRLVIWSVCAGVAAFLLLSSGCSAYLPRQPTGSKPDYPPPPMERPERAKRIASPT